MIVLKTGRELAVMREACRISYGALQEIGKAVEPGVTTAELDRLAEPYPISRDTKAIRRRPVFRSTTRSFTAFPRRSGNS